MVVQSRRLSLVGLALLAVLLGLLIIPAVAQADSTPPPGYYYTVQQGDTWSIVSRRTGVTVAELKRLNPKAIHPKGWLWVGERLFVPGKPATVESPKAAGYWYQVRPGDTWNTVAKATGVSVKELWQANPGLLNRQLWLYLGQRVWIPAAPPAASATMTTPAPAAAAAQVTPVATTAAPAVQATPAPAATAATAKSATPVATATTAPAKPGTAAGCPATLAGYPDAIGSLLNTAGKTPYDLQTWLASCGALAEGDSGVTLATLQSPTSNDLVVAMIDPAAAAPGAKGLLLIYHAKPGGGYSQARKVEGAGTLTVLRADDINGDGKRDVVWTDTTCGAQACFSTLSVESWDGTDYKSWIAGDPTIATAEYAFADLLAEGSGDEILVHGGVVEGAEAGPQRAWTETYASLKGQPYSLVNQTYDKSSCLYHALQDANELLANWATGGFDPAVAAYEAATSDPALAACWTLKDEVALLRDFARFRLVVSYVAGGQSGKAATAAAQIGQSALKGAADTFLKSYKASGSIIQACRDTAGYAEANPAAWQFLADWGTANPTFAPEDLCPLK
jgi:LysM repeat protein